jgi:hypothetical protein
MRCVLLGGLIWGLLAVVMATAGLTISTWQWWAIFALVLLYAINVVS